MHKLIQKSRAKIVAVGAAATAALAPAAAFAGEYATAVESGVDKAELTAIGVIIMSIAGIILLIRSGRKATNS